MRHERSPPDQSSAWRMVFNAFLPQAKAMWQLMYQILNTNPKENLCE
jgi:hypothetical protein